ncbi:MAG: Nramp family divalent metal transporter [Verrucomicrobiales bacterium]
MPSENPYQLTGDEIQAPPRNFFGMLRYLGPGFILSASIVGSGELIATTNLGAKAGFVAAWVIIFSCLVKVVLQLEFGKQAIYSGETTMEALNKLPGLRIGRAHWSIWAWLALMTLKLFQVAAIVGSVALIANIAMPALPATAWAPIIALVTSLLVFRGYYQLLEKGSLVMMGLFTLLTFASVRVVQFTDYAFSWAESMRRSHPSNPKAT